MYQFWTLFWRVSVQDPNSVFADIDATHPDLMEDLQAFVCALNGIHSRGLAPTIHV